MLQAETLTELEKDSFNSTPPDIPMLQSDGMT